jgi:hypothetical protein
MIRRINNVVKSNKDICAAIKKSADQSIGKITLKTRRKHSKENNREYNIINDEMNNDRNVFEVDDYLNDNNVADVFIEEDNIIDDNLSDDDLSSSSSSNSSDTSFSGYWQADEPNDEDLSSNSEDDLEDNNIGILKKQIRDNWEQIEQATWDEHATYDSYNIQYKIISYLNKKYLYCEPRDNVHLSVNIIDELTKSFVDNAKIDKIYPGSSLSKYTLEDELCTLAYKSSLSDKSRMDLLRFVGLILPDGAYVPRVIGKPTESNIMPASSKVKQSNVFIYDICLCGFTIYEGDNFALDHCESCNTRRYTNTEDTRYPIATMNYHPIIFIICELLENKEFVTALNTCNEDSGKEGLYCDVSDGAEYKKNMKQMSDKHDSYKCNKQIPEEAIKINLALSLQYDGAQVFHSTVSNFWPMLVSILNLPPNIRKTLGHGIFLISLFTALSHSSCESFIMSKCLIDELKMLEEGLLIIVDKKLYFIQARLVLLCLDSKALESICCIHGANSIIGCGLCRLSPG